MDSVKAIEARTDLFIGGQWRASSNNRRFPVIDPATEESFASVASADAFDAIAAVTAANDALESWRATPPRERGEILRRAFELMRERRQIFADMIVRENGKSLPDALAEADYAAEFFRWYSEEAVRIVGEFSTAPKGDKRILVGYQPVGVALLITPWNFPAAMATRKIGPALAAGCTVVLKPATATPLTAALVVQTLEEAGVPDGVVNLVTSSESGAVVTAMLGDERVRKLSFTGSTETGRLLLAQAANRVLNCSMELGGNAPFIVLPDADIEAAVEGAMVAKMRNGGQACTAANRFYVHSAVAEAFTSRLAAAMAKLKVGNGFEPGVGLGPLIDAAACAFMERTIQDAVEAGGRVVMGGKRPAGGGCYFLPTIIDGIDSDAQWLEREIFGPIAPIVQFEAVDEAITLANATVHGLVAYLYGGDLAQCLRIAERLQFGMVGINRGLVSDPAAPFGGMKESGIGREGGHVGMMEFLESQYLAVDW